MDASAVNILLIEDNSGDALLFTEMLSDCHQLYRVTRATRISEALTLLDVHVFDLVVMDLNLPDERGLRALARIQEKTTLPIVILTGSFDGSIKSKVLEAGVKSYLSKGKVEHAELCQAIANALMHPEG